MICPFMFRASENSKECINRNCAFFLTVETMRDMTQEELNGRDEGDDVTQVETIEDVGCSVRVIADSLDSIARIKEDEADEFE